MTGPEAPALSHVLETALYADDLERSADFYENVLGLNAMFADDRMRGYAVGNTVLLVFLRKASADGAHLADGYIPPHDGEGPLHAAFAIGNGDLPAWEQQFARHGIPIEGRVRWPRGGTSIYVRDPDGHLIELATPGLWPNY